MEDVSEGVWRTSKLVPLSFHQCDELQVPRCIDNSHPPHLPQEEQTLDSSHTQEVCSPNPSPSPWQLMYKSLPSVPTEDRKEPLTSGVIGVLLGILSPTAIAPLFCCWLKRKRGRLSARDPPRSPPRPAPQQTTYINSQALKQLQPVYENVNVVSGDEVYSLVYCTQQERPATAEEPSGTNIEDKDSSAIYYRLMADLTDVDYEDAM